MESHRLAEPVMKSMRHPRLVGRVSTRAELQLRLGRLAWPLGPPLPPLQLPQNMPQSSYQPRTIVSGSCDQRHRYCPSNHPSLGKIPNHLPEFHHMASGLNFLENFGQGTGEIIEDLADAPVSGPHPDERRPGGVERRKVGKILIFAHDDPVTGSSKFPDLAISGLGEIEGPQVLTFHTMSPEQR